MQRKITDEDVRSALERVQAGVSQKEIAAELGISPSGLNQRIQRVRSQALPESLMALTEKKRLFALGKAEGKSNVQAVKAAYDVTSDASAKAMGTQLMRDPDIGVAISDLLAQEGLSRRRRVQRLRDMIECQDLNVVGKGLDQSWKLTGDYQPEQIELITDVEIRALIAQFSGDLVTTGMPAMTSG